MHSLRPIWRVLIALLSGMICSGLITLGVFTSVQRGTVLEGALVAIIVAAMSAIPCGVALIVYFLILQSGVAAPQYETRCRRCDYILRGITEPRCPECGERI